MKRTIASRVIVLDTTVLSYATGGEHPFRDPCRQLLEAHGQGLLEATTTVEVLQEFLHVSSRRRSRTDAVALARSYGEAFDLLMTTPGDLERAFELFERHPWLGAIDAVLAAVALDRRAEALVSSDGAFGEVPDLPWMDPASPELAALLVR